MILNRLKAFLICLIVLFSALCFKVCFDLYYLLYQPMLADAAPPVTISIDRHATASSLVRDLKDKHLVNSDTLLLYLLRVQGVAHALKAGIYEVREGESAQDFISRVVAGDVIQKVFSIIEGTTQKQIAKNLMHAPYLAYKPKDWLSVQDNYHSAEGLLLADTYHYAAGSNAKELLGRAHKSLVQYLKKSWDSRYPDLPYSSPYELLIVASILEKEASNFKEKKLISGVIVNRLRKNMRLQVDPTVIYALGNDYDGKLTRNSLKVDSPFNTYRNKGLPPTPIAMVGKEAIDAAARPELTDYLYFVAKGDGTHHFSITYDEQKQAIARFLKN